jgi:hypothetical protein
MKGSPIAMNNLFVPTRLGKLSVIYENREFYVVNPAGKRTQIARADLSPDLRGISPDLIEKIAKVGRFTLSTVGTDYALRWQGTLPGGGIFGACCVAIVGTVATCAAIVGAAIAAPLGAPVSIPAIAAGGGALTAKLTMIAAGTPTP